MRPVAVVMNMFYTGLGIARSLGARGVPVIGLTSRRGIYGNFTRFATVHRCPDSREQPEALLPYLLKLGQELGQHAVIFPTRDDDIVFLDRHRDALKTSFHLVIPEPDVIHACLDKWQTFRRACEAGVASPRCWVIHNESELHKAAEEIASSCIMKPISSHVWRKHGNWSIVGGRKAIAVHSKEELLAEYAQISHADPCVLLQEMVPGGDDQLLIAACYMDRTSTLRAGFAARKLLQVPPGLGTGCIVETVQRPDVVNTAVRLLQHMHFTGIAEVEFKSDAQSGELKLIEINSRPWDQHSLGRASGTDLIYMAYCEHAELPMPSVQKPLASYKWVAEDVFFTTILRLVWRRNWEGVRSLFRLAQGKKIYGIWEREDKRPFLVYLFQFLPGFMWMAIRFAGAAITNKVVGRRFRGKGGTAYEPHLRDAKSSG